MKEVYPENKFPDIVTFNGASNVRLGGKLLKVHYPKFTVMRGFEHMVPLFFNDVFKIPIADQMIPSKEFIYIFFVLVYITSRIPFLNRNIKSFEIEKSVFLVEIILVWLDILWYLTETLGCKKFFNISYFLQNWEVFIWIKNSPKQWGTFMIINHGRGSIYLLKSFFPVWKFFDW